MGRASTANISSLISAGATSALLVVYLRGQLHPGQLDLTRQLGWLASRRGWGFLADRLGIRAVVQNLRRGHYEIAADEPAQRRLIVALPGQSHLTASPEQSAARHVSSSNNATDPADAPA